MALPRRRDEGWDASARRIHASYGATKLSYLLLPFVTAGFVLHALGRAAPQLAFAVLAALAWAALAWAALAWKGAVEA